MALVVSLIVSRFGGRVVTTNVVGTFAVVSRASDDSLGCVSGSFALFGTLTKFSVVVIL